MENRTRSSAWCLTRLGVACMCGALLAGCSMGRTQIQQKPTYVAVPSGRNTNYFRVTVIGDTRLGDTTFRSGSFPADIVDSLFGDVSKSGLANSYKLQEDVKVKINEALLKTWTGYLAAASEPKTDPEVVKGWLNAARRVRAAPGDGIALPEGAVEIEYSPDKGLVLRNSGEKLVFVLSSNPDNVIGEIAGYAKDVENSATVLRLADLVKQKAVADVVQLEAKQEAVGKWNDVLIAQIDAASKVAEGNPTRAQLTKEVDSLRQILDRAR